MKSFESLTKNRITRDTKIPSGEIPQIIAHWLCEFYYGGNLTITELRAFLEPKLRDNLHSRDAVTAWIRNAEGWARQNPKLKRKLLAQYLGIAAVAA